MMTALEWDQNDQRRYEAGVSHGVVYPSDGVGVVWNGLLSVDESSETVETNAYYVDGIRYLTTVGSKVYQSKLTAFSAPGEIRSCLGERSIIPGVYLTKQPKQRFHLSYQTGINETDYQIHLIYNALATPSEITYQTIGESIEPTKFAWKIDATPIVVPGFKPTAHLVVDSTKAPAEALTVLEGFLYGSDGLDPYFPLIETLLTLFEETP